MCGKETLAVADGIAAKYEASVKKTDGIKTIEKDVYSTYFALTAGDESSDKCSVAKYELVDKDGIANADDMYSLDGDKISVDTAKIPDLGSSVFLQAVTKGGVKATYELAFAVAVAAACNPKVTPDSDTVVIDYTDGKELDVVEELKKKFTFDARDNEDECKLDQFFIFADTASYPAAPTSTNAMDSVKLTLDDAKKGANEYLFSIGSTKNADKSALATGIIFVCGLETVTATGDAQDFAVDKAGDALKTVTKADYTAWFSFDKGDKGNADCGIKSYGLEVEDGGSYRALNTDEQLVVKINADSADQLELTVARATGPVQTFYLAATTKGGLVARKKFTFAEKGCDFEATPTPDAGDVIVVPYEKDATIDLGEKLKTLFSFTSSDETACPANKLFLYEAEAGAVVSYDGTLAKTITMADATKGKTDYYFRVGNMARSGQSAAVAKASVIICGKETLSLASSGPEVLKIKEGGSKTYVAPSVFKAWFTFDAGAESSSKCGVDKYELVDDAGSPLESTNALITLADDTITVVNAEQGPTPTTSGVNLRATTLGGVTVTKKIHLEQQPSCSLSISPADATVVVDFVKYGDALNLAEVLQKQAGMKFRTNDEDRCKISDFIQYAKEEDYPAAEYKNEPIDKDTI